MLSGDKFQIFHKYVEEIMGRPVYTHEMAIKAVDDEIKEKAKAEFIALCAEQEPKTGRWIPVGYDGYADGNPVYDWWECSECGWEHTGDEETLTPYCPNCGAKME